MSHIRVLLSTGSLWVYDTSISFEMAAEAGYDGIEVMCDNRFTTRDPGYLCRLSNAHGLPMPVLHTPFMGYLPGWGQTDTELGRVRHTLKLAEQVGAERIVVHLPMKYGRGAFSLNHDWKIQFPWRSAVHKFYRWMNSGGLKQLQSETPIQIAIENMPAKQFWGAPRQIAYWNTIEAWSRVHDYLTLDTTHWGTWGIDPLKPLRAAGERVTHVHLSNYDGREHRLPHEGDQDLATFLRELRTMDYQGTVSVEVHPDALAFDNLKAAQRKLRETLDFCREHLG